MNELDKAIAILKQRGATPADIAAFTEQWNASHDESEPPQATPVAKGTKALGVISSLLRDVPGGEAAQGVARAVVRGGALTDLLSDGLTGTGIASGISRVMGSPGYREARADIRGAEDAAPRSATTLTRMLGVGVAGMAMPGGAIASGAGLGAAHGLLESDPEATLEDRLYTGSQDAVVGGVGGAVLGAVPPALRILRGAARNPAAAGEAVKKLLPSRVQRFGKAVGELQKVGEAAAPKRLPAAPKALDEIGSDLQLVPEAEAAAVIPTSSTPTSLPNVVKATERYRTNSGALQRRGTDARFDWFKNQHAGERLISDLSPEEQYAFTLEHIRQGGTMKSAGDALRALISR